MKWLDFKIIFLLIILAIIGYGLFYFLPMKGRIKLIENSHFLIKGQLTSSEVKTEISQTKVGSRIKPVGVDLVYSYQFENQKVERREFINWERLADSEKNILRSSKNSFCLNIAFDSTNFQHGNAFIVDCNPN